MSGSSSAPFTKPSGSILIATPALLLRECLAAAVAAWLPSCPEARRLPAEDAVSECTPATSRCRLGGGFALLPAWPKGSAQASSSSGGDNRTSSPRIHIHWC